MSNAHDKHIAPDFSRLKLRLTPEFYSPCGGLNEKGWQYLFTKVFRGVVVPEYEGYEEGEDQRRHLPQ